MAVIGAIERLTPRGGYGWALDTGSDKSPLLDLRFDGEKIKTIRCQRPRPEFADAVPGGMVGFLFKLHPSLYSFVSGPKAVSLTLNGKALPILVNEMTAAPDAVRRPVSELVETLKTGHIITKQGEYRLSIQLDEDWQKRHLDFVEEASAVFKNLFGYDLYLVYGALLGLTRDGTFIRTDDDLDLSYLSRHSDPEQVRKELAHIMRTLKKTERVRLGPKRRNYFKWAREDGSALVDIFPSWVDGPNFYLAAGVGAPVADAVRKGFVKRPFLGRELITPIEAETVLEATYGPGWKVPDPTFQWVVPPHVRREMKKMTLIHRHTRALNALRPTEPSLIGRV